MNIAIREKKVTEIDKNQVPEANDNDQLSSDVDIVPKELLEGLPEEKRKEISIFVAEHFSGPLPHPKIMADYKKILPGAPERIISMAEKQQEHRINMEAILIKGDVKRADLGLNFGFVLYLLLFISGFYFIATGNNLPGYIFTGIGIILSSVSAFLRVGVERTKKEKR